MRTPYEHLTEEQKERKRESARRYHANNKEKILVQRRKYEQTDNAKELKKACEARYIAKGNRKKVEYRREHLPISTARKEARLRWSKSENGKIYARMRSAIRRSHEKSLDEFSKFVLVEAGRLSKLRQAATNIEWHIDHIIPISLGGTSRYNNIQVVPAIWNRKKSNKNSAKFFGA